MYRLLIVEDNPDHREVLQKLAESHPCASELRVDYVADAASLEARSADDPIDILLIDIDLGPHEPNGIEVVQSLFPAGSGTQVVYVTGHLEFCTRVYRTEHVYFLAKPVSKDDFDDAIDKALAKLNELRALTLAIRSGGMVKLVRPHAIDFVESDRRKVRIHLGGEVLETYSTLGDLVEQLPGSFVQCHKSFLVNMDRVVESRKDCFVLRSGEIVPISQKRRKATREAFFRHLGRQ
ncbi:LytR/AlgR family response regulator transcription factor [Arabiibacter massiliensis]|uniref:LytR/AlgR family response regulator transcription factor n=1 Tax=Arabiibacter massiliensis TaxID=1870985 RepID=UPI0009BC67BC|nr:LytTR family DNA-binding domain-containing protein [Arabiibacter massiliensis]